MFEIHKPLYYFWINFIKINTNEKMSYYHYWTFYNLFCFSATTFMIPISKILNVYLLDKIWKKKKKGTKLNWNLFMISKIFLLEKSAKICWFRRTNIHVAISWSYNNRFLHKNVWHSKGSYAWDWENLPPS